MISKYIESRLRDNSSALRYEAVTFTGGEYLVASPHVPFKGIILPDDGDVTIRGVDEVEVTVTLPGGLYPLGGIAIVEAGTTVSNIVATY